MGKGGVLTPPLPTLLIVPLTAYWLVFLLSFGQAEGRMQNAVGSRW